MGLYILRPQLSLLCIFQCCSGDINGDRQQEKIIAQSTATTHQAYVLSCNGVGRDGVEGLLIVDPEGVVLQESGEDPYMQTALIDFERVRYIREKGTSRVTTPLKDFRKNKQIFLFIKTRIKHARLTWIH